MREVGGPRSPSFRRVEIETPRRFTVCTFRGNWKFYERRRHGGKRDPRLRSRHRSPSRITDSSQAALYDSLYFSIRDIDRSRLKSDHLALKRDSSDRARAHAYSNGTSANLHLVVVDSST